MKHNVVFKFIAVLLCAASLLGAVACGFSVVVLTENGLYDRTVEQARQEDVRSYALGLSQEVAQVYSAKNLGGCPEDLLESQYGYVADRSRWMGGFRSIHSGYSLLDAEGNVLETGGALSAEQSAYTVTLPVSGKYLYVVSTTPKDAVPVPTIEATGTDKINNIPPEGITVCGVLFKGADKSTMYYSEVAEGQGLAFYNQDGQVVYRSFFREYLSVSGRVYDVVLQNSDGSVIYERHDPQGVGELVMDDNGYLLFTADPIVEEAATEPTEAETVPETVPATEAVTEPEIQYDEDGNPIPAETEPAQEGSPEEGAPEEGNPEESAPAEGNPEEGAPEEGSPEEGNPEEGAAEETTPEEGAPEEGNPEEGTPDEAAASEDPEAVTEPAETAATEAAVTEPPVTEPAATEPAVTQPAVTEPLITEPPVTEPVLIEGKPLNEYQISRYEYYDTDTGEKMVAKCVYLPMPEMTVEVYTEKGALGNDYLYDLLEVIRLFRNDLFLILAVCVLVFAITAVYLCCAAGHRPKTKEIQAGGLNRMPLDLYAALTGGGVACAVAGGVVGGEYFLEQSLQVGGTFIAVVSFAASLLIVGFLFAVVAQFKTPGGFWWRNSLIGRILGLCRTILQWLMVWGKEKLMPFLGRNGKKLWSLLKRCVYALAAGVRKMGHKIGGSINGFLRKLPMTWQWLLAGGVLLVVFLMSVMTGSVFLVMVFVALFMAAIVYGAHCFGVLMDRTKRMSRGDLHAQAEDKCLVGSFQEFAEDLNALGGVAVVAAQKQLKSERMKTELITNVSHDIKTPLTSIINYVDLLQKPHSPEEEAQYLEVLARQSDRLKKLIEDLIDMSKASTGNMNVEVRQLDAVEAVNQALGEFADKMTKAQLVPVFRHSEDFVPMTADGRLVWRVLSNLLSNAVKYALPGTRVYLDLMEADGKVLISIKNISREELNVEADELMERFVRGDDSRNTEGSGLGLNIAKSLMELQKGQLELLVDGDLFKVTLIFPGV